ncbi:uncharacterized protein ACA1_266920 [Acanthamoeba castellanii str. Neff]|uniref:Uncharacterized protein n=1 Tax=Acanthamoeba castellanii (strain ATCC 30010 / Neff) TaxID=1257118 RepID=L8H2H4_ACACF|nr:uncharacterized protein ACA1_266920 [Acanthamoeba castellanii str. Neff]ELR19435.1 hypothetical protein ACA1_266920 [Acanthamoeba castellanii str. Neff]
MEFLQGKELAGVGRLCLCMVWVCLFAQLLPPWTPAPPTTSSSSSPPAHQPSNNWPLMQYSATSSPSSAHEPSAAAEDPPTRAYAREHWVLAEVGRTYKNAVYMSREAEARDENAFITATLALGSHYLLIGLSLWLLLAPEKERSALADGL